MDIQITERTGTFAQFKALSQKAIELFDHWKTSTERTFLDGELIVEHRYVDDFIHSSKCYGFVVVGPRGGVK